MQIVGNFIFDGLKHCITLGNDFFLIPLIFMAIIFLFKIIKNLGKGV